MLFSYSRECESVHGSTSLTSGTTFPLCSVCTLTDSCCQSLTLLFCSCCSSSGRLWCCERDGLKHWSSLGLYAWLHSLIGIKAVWPHVETREVHTELSIRRPIILGLHCVAVCTSVDCLYTHTDVITVMYVCRSHIPVFLVVYLGKNFKML